MSNIGLRIVRDAVRATSSLTTILPARAMSTRTYGGLKDEDRIFQNLYGRHDWRLKGAMSRVRFLTPLRGEFKSRSSTASLGVEEI